MKDFSFAPCILGAFFFQKACFRVFLNPRHLQSLERKIFTEFVKSSAGALALYDEARNDYTRLRVMDVRTEMLVFFPGF